MKYNGKPPAAAAVGLYCLMVCHFVQHGRVQAAWHSLREQIQQQLRDWSRESQTLPSLAALWDVLVCTEDGQTIKAVPQIQHVPNPSNAHSTLITGVETLHRPIVGKENVNTDEMSFLTQKIAVLESIITKRRSMPQQQVCTSGWTCHDLKIRARMNF